MARKLQAVRIERFKCIADAPFDVGDVNVLVGANNSGKSSIIQALQFAIGVLQTIRLAGRFEQGSKTKPISTSLSPEELIYTPSKHAGAVGKGGRLFEKAGTETKITLTLDDGEACAVVVKKGKNRNIGVVADNRAVAYELASLENPFSVFSPGLAGVAKEEEHVSDGVLLRTIARGDANLVLRNSLLRLWGTPKWGEFVSDLEEIFPDSKLELGFEEKTDEFITAEVERNGDRVPLELAGTGLLQATQILSYIHQFSPAIILLDEPDSHLHPNNQRLLCTLLQKVAEDRGTQVLLTTHSRHVVDAIGATSKFLWVRNGTVDEAKPDDEIGILLDIGALDIKERAAQPGTKALVLTEDEIVRPLETVLYSSGFDKEQTALLPYHGCTNPSLLRPLIRMIQSTNKDAKIVVHRDRDFLTDDEAEKWCKEMRKLKAEPFLTDGVDLESHLLLPGHLEEMNPGVGIDFNDLIKEAQAETREKLVQKAINGRLDILRKRGESASANLGELATEMQKKVESKPGRFSHGKTVLKAVRRRFKEKTATELRVFGSSAALETDHLLAIAKKAFPKSAA